MFLKCEKGQHLTNSEQNAIDYINENVDAIGEMTISEIAEKAFVSTATISRAIKKCGIKNLLDARYQIAVKQIAKKNFVANDILEKTYIECTKTIERIDTTAVLKFVEYIQSAKKIIILAQGCATLAANELDAHLRWQGLATAVETDSLVMRRMQFLVAEGDLVVIFSVANSHPDLQIAATLAKKKGAKIITCCCESGTSLEEYSEIVISPAFFEINILENGFGTPSVLAFHIINRIIIEVLSTTKNN